MLQTEFKYRLAEATKDLLLLTRPMVTNMISQSVQYLIESNSRLVGNHLSEREVEKLHELNELEGQLLSADRVVQILHDPGRVPLWINMEVERSTKDQTIVKLICSRRLRSEHDLNDKIDAYPPFHPLVPLPPWYKEGEKFDINWKRIQRRANGTS